MGLVLTTPGVAQPLTERSPNMEGTWVTSPRNLHFQFAHRFEVAGEDADIGGIFGDGFLVNYPTFALTYGVVPGVMAGVRYSSKSLVMDQLNEWQPYLKWAPLRRSSERPWSLSMTGAYNGAASSLDGELAFQADVWKRVILLGAVRGFTDTFRTDTTSLALAAGAGFRINRYVTLTGDIAEIVAGVEDTPTGWSAGVHLGIPHTPHTFSIMATNVTSGTLQGTSTGVEGEVYWGFEFTVPFSGFARWGKIFKPEEVAEEDFELPPGGAVVEVHISRFSFGPSELQVPPGTTVRWINKDPVVHTSTSDADVWGSPALAPGESFSFTFEEPGTYPYHCIPHPVMKATIVVTYAPEPESAS